MRVPSSSGLVCFFSLLLAMALATGCDNKSAESPVVPDSDTAAGSGGSSSSDSATDAGSEPMDDASAAVVGDDSEEPDDYFDTVKLTGENTKLTFVGRKTDGSHEGGFADVNGTLLIDPDSHHLTKITLNIDTESLWSDDDKLTNHLKSPDFFNVREHPKATFKSTKIERNAERTLIQGDLTLLGETKPVEIPAKVTVGEGPTVVLDGTFTVSRKAFGMTYGDNIEDEVEVTVAVNEVE